MNNFTLDSLMEGLTKSASEESELMAKKEEEAKLTKKDEKKEEGKESKKEEAKETQEKTAAFKAGADLAKEIMEKVASAKTEQTNKGEDMNKQASDAGKALAQALLKQAGVGDVNTSNGIPAGVVPNKTQVDLAQQKAEHDMVFQPTPGTDGLGNGGTINQIFDAIVADAMARGVKDEQVTGNTAQAEGVRNAAQVPAQVQVAAPSALGGESQEKSAAVASLVNDGMDFDQAVNLVKEAAEALEAEHETQVKQAAFNELLSQGLSFTDAVNMVKSAGVKAKANVDQEKQAAVNQLVEAGVDFDQAIDLVNSKSAELYGK